MNKQLKIFLLEFLLLLCLCTLFKKLIIGYIFIIFHEIVHIIIAHMYKIKTTKFNLHVTGSSCSFSDFANLNYYEKIIIYISGPMFNLCVFIIFFFINNFIYNSQLIGDISLINLFLCIFNLLPAFPLDGGRIFEAFLSKGLLYKSAKKILKYTSLFVSFMFVFLFVYTIYIHKINFSFLIASILIMYSTAKEMKKNIFVLICSVLKKKDSLIKRGYIENKNISIYYKCTLNKAILFLCMNKLNYIYVVDDKLKLLKIINENELLEALKLYGDITFKDFIEKTKSETIFKE